MTVTNSSMTAPTVGLAEAAQACGVSESTIRRRREELKALGAVQGPRGWQIPIPALVQLGLMASTTAPDNVTAAGSLQDSPAKAATTGSNTGELEALREALRAAELRAAVAEARAEERERIISAQAQALRMLEAPQSEQPTPETDMSTATVTTTESGAVQTPQRRRWWHF